MKNINRRDFIKTTSLGGAALAGASLLAACSKEEDKTKTESNTNDSKKATINLRLAMTWPITMPVLAQSVEYFASQVKAMSGGSINIEINPAGKLVPALGVFDAASSGQIDLYHSAPYYWEGKNTVFNMFSGIPFGMIDGEMNAWYMFGDGMDLWREACEPYNLYPMLGGATSIQMAGWYKKPINSVKDFQGLKIRMVGVGAQVLSKLGAVTKNTPGGEILPSLSRGQLDAAEWVAPAFDRLLGIHKEAKYYYAPWQEAGSITEFVFNKSKWDSLPEDAKAILQGAANQTHLYMTALGQFSNGAALLELQKEGAQIMSFSDEILAQFKVALKSVLQEESQKNPQFAKVLASYEKFQKEQGSWTNDSLGRYLNLRNK